MNSEWIAIVNALLGRLTESSRDGDASEILGYQMCLHDLESNFLDNDVRKLSPVYASAELLWYLSGTKDIEMIKAYAPQYERFAENDEAYGAYGYRWAMGRTGNQFTKLIDLLMLKPSSRQAVISMWEPADLGHAITGIHKDIPCTLSLQFFIRDGSIHQIATMRSNDVWLGLPYDVYCFTSIQRILADCLGVKVGQYWHQAGSEHLYKRNREKAEQAVHSSKLSYRNSSRVRDAIGYGKLFHGFLQQTQTAVALEKEVRETGELDFELLNKITSSILRDTVLLCATKWTSIDTDQEIYSQLFRSLMTDG